MPMIGGNNTGADFGLLSQGPSQGSKMAAGIGLALTLCLLLISCKMEVSTNESTEKENVRKIGTVEGIESTVYQYDAGLYRGGDVF